MLMIAHIVTAAELEYYGDMLKKSTALCALILVVFISLPQFTNANTLKSVIGTDDVRERPERPLRPERPASEFREDEIIVKLRGADAPIRVQNTERRNVRDLVREYEAREDVEYAEPNYIAYALAVPNDPYFNLQWNFSNSTYGGVHATEAWDSTNGGGVVIAVIDTGVAYENYGSYYRAPDLAGTKFVQGYDFVNNDTHANDDEGHGTHVTGTIAQTTNNATGVAGLAYGASIMPLKVLNQNGSGTYADIVEAIRYAADKGAKVINMSLGGSASSAAMAEAVTYAHNKGVTIVAAAGNSNSSGSFYPAAYPEVISVGATRFDETRAPYSNYGPTIDLVAPGGDTKVDQNNDGYVDCILQQTFGSSRSNFSYYFYQGTSMASPHVAAAAALLIASGVATSPDDIRAKLQSTADDLGASGRDNTYGHGLLNVAAALQSNVTLPEPEPEPEPEAEPDALPTVTITTPNGGSTVSGTVSIAADASDDNGVASIEFKVNGTSIGTDGSAPYTASWDTTSAQNDTYTVSAIATDSVGQTASHSINLTVGNVTEEPQTLEVFADGFESGLGLWTQDSQQDWFASTQRELVGARSLQVDGFASNASVMTSAIDLQGKTNATITYSWFIESVFDRGEYIAFDVSLDGGSTWQNLAMLRGNQDPENIWHHKEHKLTNISSLRLRFRGTVSADSEDANVDNLVVTASN
jgi:serine protease